MRTQAWLSLCCAGALLVGCQDAMQPGGKTAGKTAMKFAMGQSNRAVVIRDGGCALLDGLGNLVTSRRSNKVGTHSGTAKFSCHAKVRPSPTGRAVHYDGDHHPDLPEESPCGIELPEGLFLTNDWHETVSASGMATLVCRVPQGSEPTEIF
jgi:hypothetical protein